MYNLLLIRASRAILSGIHCVNQTAPLRASIIPYRGLDRISFDQSTFVNQLHVTRSIPRRHRNPPSNRVKTGESASLLVSARLEEGPKSRSKGSQPNLPSEPSTALVKHLQTSSNSSTGKSHDSSDYPILPTQKSTIDRWKQAHPTTPRYCQRMGAHYRGIGGNSDPNFDWEAATRRLDRPIVVVVAANAGINEPRG